MRPTTTAAQRLTNCLIMTFSITVYTTKYINNFIRTSAVLKARNISEGAAKLLTPQNPKIYVFTLLKIFIRNPGEISSVVY